jgi:hypothetical protein
VVSDTQMTANVTITTNAATGPRDVYVTNLGPGGGYAVLTSGFVVGNNPSPTLTSVTPNTARRLDKLDLVFRGTNFIGGVTEVDLGADITVNSLTVDSTGRLTANISVLTTAVTGSRTVYLRNAPPGGGVDSIVNGFTVTNPLPTLTGIAPNAGNRLMTLNVVLRGSNFIDGTTTLNIGSDIVLNSLTVDSATRMTANITVGGAAAAGLRNVFVNNPEPGGGNSNVQTFAVNLAPPPTPALLSPSNGAPFLPTNPVLRWNAASGASSYYLQLGTSTLFSTNVVDDSLLTGTSRQVGPLQNGQTYYWRVRAKNSGGVSPFSEIWSFRPDYPTTLVLSNQVSFPAYTSANSFKASDWRIVGLPGAGTTLISTFMSGTQRTDWNVFTDNGASGTSGYLTEYNGTSDFTFANGKAFWMIKKNIWTVGVSVEAAVLDSSASVRVYLHKGWNLITNPFDKVVPWSSVQLVNGSAAQSPLWAFNGLNGFQQSSSLDPYVGYYFYNTDSVAYVRIPYGATSGVMKADSLQRGEWTVAVEARSGLQADRSLSFGTRTDASNGIDRYDFRKPRAMGDASGAVFLRPDLDALSSAFATDFRPPVDKIARWSFEVRTPPKEQVSLGFAGIGQIPEELEVYLIDHAGSRYANLRSAPEYRYVPALLAVQFTVAVGSHEAMAAELSDVLPKAFGLENNFPNPFNPSTTIPVAVPHTAELAVTIYNILGEEVRTVFQGTKEAGRYWVTWDGRNDAGRTVASGVYIVRLSAAEGVSVVKKMMMLK